MIQGTMMGAAGTAVVIGSGLSPRRWPGKVIARAGYAEVGGMEGPSVDGHPGDLLLLGTGSGNLLVFAGRTHLYEGGGWEVAGCAATVAASLGCRRIILTQAAGSLRRSLPPGSWLLPSGIVSMPWTPSRFPSIRRPRISPSLRRSVALAAAEAGIGTVDGILFWTAGPAYETPAEAGAAVMMGADAATMSPLPELAAAAAAGLEAACLSLVTNFAPNVSPVGTGHLEVLRAGGKGAEGLSRILPRLAKI
jgi:purine-nucleoside phosphorylase